MLLIDASNLFYSTAADHFTGTREPVNATTVRYVLTSRLMTVTQQMSKVSGAKILAFDDGQYWRRDVFPYYKAKRAEKREKSGFDWDAFFPAFDIFKQELRENFPFQCLQVPRAEADDIIAILGLRAAGAGEEVTIWSADTDNLQLQLINPKIKQYSYVKKKNITPKAENYTLFEHIVRGDIGDGIPNILSRADHFVNNPEGKRQKSVFAQKLDEWVVHEGNPEAFCTPEMLERYKLNKILVDYRNIPADLARAIVEAHETTPVAKGKIFNYMIKNRMTNLMKNGAF